MKSYSLLLGVVLGIVIPAVLVTLVVLFKVLFTLLRLENKLNEIRFELIEYKEAKKIERRKVNMEVSGEEKSAQDGNQ
jgi:hypothetical protein